MGIGAGPRRLIVRRGKVVCAFLAAKQFGPRESVELGVLAEQHGTA